MCFPAERRRPVERADTMKKNNGKRKNPFREMWDMLNRTIYVGERYQANMNALLFVSIVTTVLGLVLIIVNITTGMNGMLVAAILTFVAGAGCGYCVRVLKNREIAILIPTTFCAVAFTIYLFTGAGEGSAIMWSLLMPIGMCYFVSVKYGIILSTYHSLLYIVVFYSPLKGLVSSYYTPAFVQRFPLLFISLSLFTGMAMVQYHRNALLEIDYNRRLNEEVARQTAVAEERARQIEQMSFQTIQTLANAIDAKDPYTKGHSSRVSQYSVLIAQRLGWSDERINDLRYAALLHDIGKIGVPDSILNNPRRLTEMEYSIIKSHTTMGGEILKNRIMIKAAEDVATSHHERYDGRGYPRGLAGKEISEEARIVAIADAFDAMKSNRVYRMACRKDHIRHELTEGRGRQFDPEFTDVFIDLWDSGKLDEISEADSPGNEGSREASSVLLQEVMDAFMGQNSLEDIDIICGIPNRSAGEAAIAQAMKEEPGCFVFFDMDNLKKVNDTNGHEAGDRALKLMGDTLKACGEDCLCCRLGGDEFLLYIKNASEATAEARVRGVVAAFESGKQGDAQIAAVSLSAGMVMCTPADSYAKVYNMADKALYHIKQNGKNDCAFYNIEAENFVSESVDVQKLAKAISDSGSYEGALDVEYRQFAKLYEFIGNMEKRFSHPYKLVMITLETGAGHAPDLDALERSMYYMEQAIRQTIRNVDVLTRYSRQQFLIILTGTDTNGVRIAVDRIFRGYYKMNGSGAFSPSYAVADIDVEKAVS